MNHQGPAPSPQVQSPGEQAKHRADKIDDQPKSKHRHNEYEATIENAGAISVGRRNRRRSLNLTASEPLMDRGLNPFEPLANLNIVVATDVPQHESRAARPLDLQIDNHFRLVRSRTKLKIHHRPMQEALALAAQALGCFSDFPAECVSQVRARCFKDEVARRRKYIFLMKVLVLPIHERGV